MIAVPIFDCLIRADSRPSGAPSSSSDCSGESAGGANSWYHVAGWATFYLTGYKVGGSQQAASLRTGAVPCSGSERCLSGWFTRGVLSADSILPPGGDDDFGAVVIRSAG